MGLDDIDISSWGKKPEKKDRPPKDDAGKKEKPAKASRPAGTSTKQTGGEWPLKAKQTVLLKEVPIDALRGLFYFTYGFPDKKMTKTELKRNLKEVLSSRKRLDKVLQGIADVIFS